MPVIKVWCLPNLEEAKLNRLFKQIVRAVEGVKELGITGEQSMTILFPVDQMAYGLGTEIIIEVTGLFEKPERTSGVRQRLAKKLGFVVKRYFPKANIECFVYSFNTTQGFWTSSS